MSTCETDQFVNVEVVSTKKPTATVTYSTIAQLPERAQKELIKSLVPTLKKADSLAVFLATDIKKKPKVETDPYQISGVNIDRRIVLKVDKIWAIEKAKDAETAGVKDTPDQCGKLSKRTVYFNDPGDRVMNLEVNLRLPANSLFAFADWDKFQSQFLNVDLGSVSSTLNLSLAAEVAANASGKITTTGGNTGKNFTVTDSTGNSGSETGTAGSLSDETGFTFGPKVTGSIGSQYVSSQTLANQYLRFNGILRPDGFNIRQDGAPGNDLSGNSEVFVTLKYTGTDWASLTFHRFKDLYKDGKPNAWGNVTLSTVESFYPNVSADISADVDFNFLFRNATSGRRHIPESRQRVTHAYGRSKSKSCVILPAVDLKPAQFKLVMGANALLLNSTEVVLQDAASAAQLLAWLRQAGTLPGAFTVGGNAPLPALLQIKQF